MLLFLPLGSLPHRLLEGSADALDRTDVPTSPREVPFQSTAFIDLNLSFVLLAALSAGPSCHCLLRNRVQRSSIVFLRLTHERIRVELNGLSKQGLLIPDQQVCCDVCDESYRLSTAGQEHLAASLEEWQLSRLANLAVTNLAVNG